MFTILVSSLITTGMHRACQISENCIGGIMVSVLASSVVDRCFQPRLGQTKDCLARNQNNVSEWRDVSTRGLLF